MDPSRRMHLEMSTARGQHSAEQTGDPEHGCLKGRASRSFPQGWGGTRPPTLRSGSPAMHATSSLTIKDRPAVLGGGGQRQAGGVGLVAIVPNADLELDGVIGVLQHGGRVEGSKERVLAPPEVLLGAEGSLGVTRGRDRNISAGEVMWLGGLAEPGTQ